MMVMVIGTDEDLLPFDNTCPHCGDEYCVDDEVFDGSHRNCTNCGKRVVAVAWTDDTMSLIDAEPKQSRLTGRKKTRAKWRRQGRR